MKPYHFTAAFENNEQHQYKKHAWRKQHAANHGSGKNKAIKRSGDKVAVFWFQVKKELIVCDLKVIDHKNDKLFWAMRTFYKGFFDIGSSTRACDGCE